MASLAVSAPTTVPASISHLAQLRARNLRNSQDVLNHGAFLFEHVGPKLFSRMGDTYWAFLEQVAVAALDLNRDDLADECIAQLDERFPESPRVQVLRGMKLEATGRLDTALELYEAILEVDDSNAAIWKRHVAVYKAQSDPKLAIADLVLYLDTFYADVEGWLELAELYASQKQYAMGLQALSHALAIAPQNSFYVLRFAEMAVSAGKTTLGMRMFLRCIEMDDDDDAEMGDAVRKAWEGVQSCASQMLTAEGGREDLEEVGEAGGPMDEDTLRGLMEVANEKLMTG